jgi:hypothetical protein
MTATEHKAAPESKKKRRGLSGWLTSFSGILASVATIVAAVASLLAAHQTSRVNELTIVVKQQEQKLQQARSQSTASPAPSGAASSGVIGGALPPGGIYLSATQPTVNNAYLGTGPKTISAKVYPDTNTFECFGPLGNGQPDVAFDVAGHAVFKAEVGIPDNATDATNLDETVVFANQAGTELIKPVVVSLGHPADVQLNISAVTQLEVTCTGVNTENQSQDNDNELALGNAFVS